jgi:signal transduction histidine kinase
VADEQRLFNALYNLINNGLYETPSGGSVTLAGSYDAKAKQIELAVIDTGAGMSEEVRRTLFTSRVQSRKAGGTGLGTKIVKDVIDAHNGTITVESEPGRGATFRIRLPLTQPS